MIGRNDLNPAAPTARDASGLIYGAPLTASAAGPVMSSKEDEPSTGLSALQALTVDLWYTLIFPTAEVRAAIEEARRAVWTEALREQGCSPRRAESWAAEIERSAESDELTGWSPSWSERVERWSQRTGVTLDADRLSEQFTAQVPLHRVRVAPGADQALRLLRRRGLHLAIVSNATHEPPQAVHELLARHQLDRRFDSVVLSPDVGRAKPRREPFRQALADLGTAPGSAVHIGDSPADFEGAIAAGIRPLLFTGLNRWKPERLRRARAPWMRRALKVDRWDEVPPVAAFFGSLPPLPIPA
jgi:HAD superfamily hydrolase (TIGR01509 family)